MLTDFHSEEFLQVLSVDFPVEGIGDRLLICFLLELLVDVVQVGFLVDDSVEVGEVLLEATGSQSVVELFVDIVQPLSELTQLGIDLVDIALGVENPAQFLN